MSAREALAVPPPLHPPTEMGRRPDPAPAGGPRPPHCSACGGAWFGEVAYCPHCGHASALATASAWAAPHADPPLEDDDPLLPDDAPAGSPWARDVPRAGADASARAARTAAAAWAASSRAAPSGPPDKPWTAGAMRIVRALAGTRPHQPRQRWTARWLPAVGLAALLALLAITAQEFAGRSTQATAPGAARQPPATLAAGRGPSVPAPGAPEPRGTQVLGAGPAQADALAAPPLAAAASPAPAQPANAVLPPPGAPAPPAQPPDAPRRSLCSAADEAAGLCTPR